jgi:preprotein translocase subunit SecE
MNAKTETPSGTGVLDSVKLVLAATLLVGGIVSYYWFVDASVLLRAVGVVLSVALAIVVFLTTDKGRDVWRFIQTSRVELRKVVWPTRQEAFQTTMAVIIFVIILAVFFWGLDMFLLWATRLLTGQGA